MSARAQPLVRVPRSFVRRAVLLLAFAAAFLPTVIPGLHAGHSLPTFAPVVLAVGHPATSEYHGHGAGHHHAMNQHSEPSGTPTPGSKRPESGACPICRTLQQLAAWTVPDSAVVAVPLAIAIDRAALPIEAPTVHRSYTPAQPRAPPVAV